MIGLSVLLRGSVTEKLNWAFNLYDINKDGYITKEVLVLMLQRLLHWHFCKADSNSNTFVCVGDAVNHEVNLRHDGQVHLPQCARWSSIWTCGKVLPGISNKHIYMKTQNQLYQSIKSIFLIENGQKSRWCGHYWGVYWDLSESKLKLVFTHNVWFKNHLYINYCLQFNVKMYELFVKTFFKLYWIQCENCVNS